MTQELTLLSHEWLELTGGSENVFEELQRAFPGSRALSLWNDARTRFPSAEETWLARTPLRKSKALALPFMWAALRSVDLSEVSRVISSSHAFGHYLATRAVRLGIPGFAYVHSPARYIWVPELDVRGSSLIGRLGQKPLRRLDRSRVDARVKYAANSEYVRKRIQDCWGMEADVIYPPVEVTKLQNQADWRDELSELELSQLESLPKDYIIGASRMIPYKRHDMVIKVGEMIDQPVVLAGDGPSEQKLKQQAAEASIPVHFMGRVSSPMLYALLQNALLFVFPPVEDFGIMPVEAAALGTPVLVNSVGGAAESVAAMSAGFATGFLDDEIAQAAETAMSMDMAKASVAAQGFSVERFHQQVLDWTK